MIHSAVLALAVVAGWLALAVLQRRLPVRQRSRAFWALIVTGIPVLGWLTLTGGPIAGVAGLALGFAILLRAPRRRPGKRAMPPLD
ncbi:DUF2484 family protein [Paracoccus sp. S3-43]|uniref:DUF2484 family protein n=1 Tax=Paracoccus sp. S3-43 TaxID=3030011 RepID=UPI0023B19C95|nr:DUF2484 family protein [Paracoccus sp. S3-43]WEF25215.1 DUF2484 family protein [Paracoccus sp. S3-43]